MSERAIEIARNGPVATIWLNRPEIHNALDPELIEELIEIFQAAGRDDDVRVILISGRGRSFSAGAQAQWMKQQGSADAEENMADARRLAELFHVIAESPKTTLARVQGSAIGGGVGLIAACDIAIGVTTAVFATTEVRLGLIPATIAPYVVKAIGERQARRFFLTAEHFDALTAQKIGLLHEVTDPEQLDECIGTVIEKILAGAPRAQTEAKELIRGVIGKAITAALIQDTARWIASRRADPEALEGLDAFLSKRPAAWVPEK